MLRDVFCRFGMPDTLVSDNGRQFTSDIFLDFCTKNGIEHVRSPPYHPQSNGQAERFVDTFKRSLAKIHHPEGDLQVALDTFLLNYRITPNRYASSGKSPSELLFGRRIRSNLDLLLPSKNIPQDKVPAADRIRRFESGDAVYVQQHVRESTKWSPGEVVKCLGNVLYTVQLDNGRIVTAHVNQMIRRYGGGPSNKPQLPLDILVDSFDMYPTKQIATPQLPVEGVNNEVVPLRRSGRTRNVPVRYRDYHLY